MDKRALTVVALVAVLAAVGLGVLFAPSTDTTPVAATSTTPEAAPELSPAEQASRRHNKPIAPLKPVPREMLPTAQLTPAPRINPNVAAQPLADAQEQLQQNKEYRCRALGQQTDLIDRLTTIGSGTAVDHEQRIKLLGRVARLSVQVWEEGENIANGVLDCGPDLTGVDLGTASDFLRDVGGELAADLDDNELEEIEQALQVIDGER